MTKYILHGGETKKHSKNNKNFFRESVGTAPHTKILVVLFAREEDLWEEIYSAIQKFFTKYSPEKELEFLLASPKIDELIKQIKNSNVIYMHGGNTHKLKEMLDKIPNLENLWKNKIISGSSAGALVLSKYWYENDDDSYNEGLGILPIKLFCHYKKENNDRLEKLKQFGEPLPTYSLPEEIFFILES